MNFNKSRKWIVALLALMLVVAMAGCKGESSPTAPSTTTSGGNGQVTPPTGASVTLVASSTTPVIDSSSVLTATVTQGGTAVPNGTAVEFQTDAGSFVQGADPAVLKIIKTTTNGVAQATIFSSTVVTATITATVNNVTKSVVVRFVDKPVVTPPQSTAPTISGVSPALGSPNGGQIVTITGTNFRGPISVLWDPGNGQPPIPVTATLLSENAIQAITPKVNIVAGQQVKYNVTVITQQGSTSEQRVSSTGAFTYQLDVLTPAPTTASPASGPIDGGTRVTIFGSGFQTPVQVFFGNAEAQVIKTTFDQLIVISPTARSAGVTTGAVPIRIININSVKEATLSSGFNYAEKIAITAMGPTQGPYTGGTRVTIEGAGFDVDGVAVVIGGIGAQPVFVSGTKIIAITGAPVVTSCANIPGATSVVNIANGEQANGIPFTFIVQKPTIVNVTNPITPGGNAQITVQGSSALTRIQINGQSVPITATVQNANGTTTYTVVVPSNLKFDTSACPTVPGVNAQVQTGFDVVVTNPETTCTDTLVKGAVINPPAAVVAFAPTAGFGSFTTILPQPGPPPVAGTPAPAQTVVFTNTGSGTLTVTGVSQAGAGCANFAVSTPSTPASLAACDPFPVQVNYKRNTAGNDQCTLTVSTSAGSRTMALSGQAQ